MYESLENWLSPRVGASRVRVIDATLPKSGYSAETLVLAVEIEPNLVAHLRDRGNRHEHIV